MANNFYQIGAGLGSAYMDGKDAEAAARARELQNAQLKANTDQTLMQTRRARGLVDDEEYARNRARSEQAARDSFYGAAPPAGPPGIPQGPSAPAPAQGAGLGATPSASPSPAASPKGAPSPADTLRFHAQQAGRKGDATTEAALIETARQMDAREAFQRGQNLTDEEVDKRLAAANNTKDFPLTTFTLRGADGKPTGYETLVLRPNGSTHKVTMSPTQIRLMAGYAEMAKFDAQAGLKGIASIDGDLATAFAVRLKQHADVTKTNNDATHQLATDETGRSNAATSASRAREEARSNKANEGIRAGEAATRAALTREQISEIRTGRANNDEARALTAQFDALTPAQQEGAEGLALRRRFNLLNAKPGGQLQAADPRAAGGRSGASLRIKYETDNLWADAEKKLMGDNTPTPDIQKQKDAFYARAGFAPAAAVNVLLSGRNPADGTKMTKQDVDAFNATFPHSRVDPANVPWLAPQAAPPAAAPRAAGLPDQRPSETRVVPGARPARMPWESAQGQNGTW